MKHSWFAALPAAALLPSCLSFQYEGEEVHMRYDAEVDRLEIAVVFSGVHAGSGVSYTIQDHGSEPRRIDSKKIPGGQGAVEAAAGLVEQLGAGRRYLLFYDWPLIFDLDSEKLGQPLDDPAEEAMRQDAAAFAEGVRVDRSRLFRDEAGKLGIVQHFVVDDLSQGLAVLNDSLNEALLANRSGFLADSREEAGEEGEPMLPDLSLATRGRWVEWAEAGERWVRIARGGLELRVPLSSAEFALVLRSIVAETADSESDAAGFFVPVSAALSEITHRDGVLVARFLPDASGWLSFAFTREEWVADGRVLALLREREVAIAEMSLAEARAFARGE